MGESSKSNRKKDDSVIRGTSKLFTGLKRNTDNYTVDLLSGYNFQSRAQLLYQLLMEKWNRRKIGDRFLFNNLPKSILDAFPLNKRNVCKKNAN